MKSAPKFNSLLITFLAIALIIISTTANARLEKKVIPTHQKIELKIDSDTSHYTGSVKIYLDVIQATSSFQLYAEEMQLDKIQLFGNDGEIAVTHEIGKHGLLTINSSTELKPGSYTLHIDFTDDYNTDAVGLYRVIEDGRGYLFTQFEEDDAREAFPCFDEPDFKITFDLTLIVPEEHSTVANTPIDSEKTNDGWKTVVFSKTKPLPTYLLAISTGMLEYVDIEGMPVPGKVYSIYGKSHLMNLAAKMTPPILEAMTEYFGRPYPYKKLDLMAVPEFWAGAMENAGLITFREVILTADEKTATVKVKRRMALIIAHEIAHMWFGDLVTMEWWDDLWLNEAFASWIGDKITDQVFPEFNMDLAVTRSSQSVMRGDTRQSTSPIKQETQDEENLLQNIGIIYNKGQAVLEMFENWLGQEDFQKGIKKYINDNEWGNATASDLWTALSEASGRDINTTMATFIIQPGVPLVTVEAGAAGKITISQKRMSNYGVDFPNAPLWQIPVTLKYETGGTVQTYTTLLTEKSQTFILPGEAKPNWVLPNADMKGYYRWNTSPDMLKKMAETALPSFTQAEKIGFLSNMSGLLDAGLIAGSDYLSVITQLANDQDPEIIRSVIGAFYRIHSVFSNDDNEDKFASLIRTIFKPAVDKYGLTKNDGEPESITMMRPSLFAIVAQEGKDEELRNFAKEQAEKYSNDPTSVDMSQINLYLSITAIDGDQKLYDEYKQCAEQADTPRKRIMYLSALGGFHDDKIIEQALEYTLNANLKSQERSNIPFSVAGQSNEKADYMLGWVVEHYDEIVALIPPPSRRYLVYFMAGCSENRLNKGLEFFSKPEINSPGIQGSTARIAESVEDCVDLKNREQESVMAFIEKFNGSTE